MVSINFAMYVSGIRAAKMTATHLHCNLSNNRVQSSMMVVITVLTKPISHWIGREFRETIGQRQLISVDCSV